MKKLSILTAIALILCMVFIPGLSAAADGVDGYILPRNSNPYTYLTGEGRVILGIQYRGGAYSPGTLANTSKVIETFVTNAETSIKEGVYINGVKLADALAKADGTVKLSDIGNESWMQIQIRYADAVTSAPVENPFHVHEGDGIAFHFEAGQVLDYNIGETNAYLPWNGNWQAINGIKYAVLRNTSDGVAYYPDNMGKFNFTFNVRNGNAISYGNCDAVALTDNDVANIAKVTEINGVNYYNKADGDTVKYVRGGVHQYYYQFRVGAGSVGNPFGIAAADNGSFHFAMTAGVLTASNYYIAPCDFAYDLATRTQGEYVPPVIEVDGALRNLVPNESRAADGSWGLTGPSVDVPGRYYVWFNVRNTDDNSTVPGYVVKTDANFAPVKENLYINGVNLGDAMDKDSSVEIIVPDHSSTGNGQFYVSFVNADEDGNDVENPFGIYNSTRGFRVQLTEAISLSVGSSEYHLNPIDYYYTAATEKFSFVKGEKALVPSDSSQNYNNQRAISKFYLRNLDDNKPVGITLTEADRNNIADALYINGQPLMSGICTNVTTSSGAGGGYFQLNMFIFGDNDNTVGITDDSGFRMTLDGDVMISGYLVHGFDVFCHYTNTDGQAQFKDFIACADANGDAEVNVLDLVRVKKIMAASENYDANLDGDTDAEDLTFVRSAILGIYDLVKE